MGRGRNRKILIICTQSLARFVDAEPVFEAIRARHPDASISLLTSPSLQRVARAAPYFNQVAAIPDVADAETRREFVTQLRSQKFERVYDLSADTVS